MKSQEYNRLIADVILNPSGYGLRECTICGRGVIHFVGIWIPDEKSNRLLGSPPDKHRTVLYALCEECSQDEEKALDTVQLKIIKDIQQEEPGTTYEILS